MLLFYICKKNVFWYVCLCGRMCFSICERSPSEGSSLNWNMSRHWLSLNSNRMKSNGYSGWGTQFFSRWELFFNWKIFKWKYTLILAWFWEMSASFNRRQPFVTKESTKVTLLVFQCFCVQQAQLFAKREHEGVVQMLEVSVQWV